MANDEETVIGLGAQLTGDLTFEKTARIVGSFEGTISGTGRLHIDEKAVCKANISVGTVVIDGAVEGNITASERVQLNSKAKITGDVAGPKVVMADGASLVGQCKIGSISPGATTSRTSTAAPPEMASRPAMEPRRPQAR